MSISDTLPSFPPGSTIETLISAVGAVYARLALDQRAFLESAAEQGKPLLCPSGCGACCHPFVPDILPAEAAFTAAWLIAKKPELAEEVSTWPRGGGEAYAPPCPFLRATAEGEGCAIYPARFLICRLFGASGLRDKDGRTIFRPCAHMPLAGYPAPGRERPQLVGDRILVAFGAEAPIMADYAAEIVALAPSDSGERQSVREALPRALNRVGLMLSLANNESDRSYSAYDESKE
jgi:uncharacterized protein